MIRIYTTPVMVDSNGMVVNPEPDVVVIDGGVEYVPAARTIIEDAREDN